MPRSSSPPDQEPPQQIGDYRILAFLSHGGMGHVYRAGHVGTGRPAALKIVHNFQEPMLFCIRREIHALRQLRHPGIIEIYDEGVHEGRPWFAMELLRDGQTLAGWHRRLWGLSAPAATVPARPGPSLPRPDEPPPPPPRPAVRPPAAQGQLDAVLDLFCRLCDPLAFLHGEGMVHGDLKPNNIYLRPNGTPVLMDFGLVHRFPGAGAREVAETGVSYGGTTGYMSPEQVRALPLDARADLYVLGVLLYELITGQPPFAGRSREEIDAAHLEQRPVPPSERVSGVPPALDELVLRLLAKEPRERIGYAADVRAALQALGAPAPAPAPARTYVYRPALRGRETVIIEMVTAIKAAHRGEGAFALLGGPSGIGKTYLAAELARAGAVRGMHAVAATCSPSYAAPLHAFVPLLEAIADHCLDLGAAQGREAADEVLGPRGKVLAAFAPRLRHLPGQEAYPDPPELPPDAARDRVLHALAETLLAFSRHRPLLLLLDDLQWADSLSLSFLSWLPQAALRGHRLLLLGTHRTDQPYPGLEALLRRPGLRAVDLPQLGEQAIGTLVGDMLALAAPPAPLVSFLARHSLGNPFFVAEYLRAAVDEGLLRRDDRGQWRAEPALFERERRAPGDLVPLPLALRDLIVRRLDGLSADGRALCEVAAALGKEFAGDLLLLVADQAGVEWIDPLHELLARHLLADAEGGRLRFGHDKYSEIAHERILPERRRALHRAAALAVEGRFPGPAERRPFHAMLIHHFTEAGEPARAFDYLVQAGQEALDAGAPGMAGDYLRRAIELDQKHHLCAGPLQRARLWRMSAQAVFAHLDAPETDRHLRQALSYLGHRLPGSQTGWNLYLARHLAIQIGHLLRRGAGLAARAEEQAALTEAAAALEVARLAYLLDNRPLKVLAATLHAANLKDRTHALVPRGAELASLGTAAGLAGLRRLADFYFHRARQSIAQTGDVHDELMTTLSEAFYYMCTAQWSSAQASAAQGLARALDAGHFYGIRSFRLILPAIAWMGGDLEGSMRQGLEFEAAARIIGDEGYLAWSQAALGTALLRMGRLAEARARMEMLWRSSPDRATSAGALGMIALSRLEEGDLPEAYRIAEEVREASRQLSPQVFGTATIHLSLPVIYLACWEDALRRKDRAAAPIQQAQASCRDAARFARLYPFMRPNTLRYQGQVLWLENSRHRAHWYLKRAATMACQLHMPYEEALAHHEMACRGTPGSAEQRWHARRAHELFTMLGNDLYRRRIESAGWAH